MESSSALFYPEQFRAPLAEARLPTPHGEFRLLVFTGDDLNREHLALVLGPLAGEVLVRIHSECLTGDVFGSRRCDCGEQLDLAMARIAATGQGVVVYLRQEGRGIGLVNKLHAYNLQDQGLDTVEANLALGFADELREYSIAAEILDSLGVSQVALMTNNPHKMNQLRDAGFEVRRVAHETAPQSENRDYLSTKASRMGHLLSSAD